MEIQNKPAINNVHLHNVKIDTGKYLVNQIKQEYLNSVIKVSKSFVAFELPILNQQINQGIINNSDFIRAIKPQVESLCSAVNGTLRFNNISCKTARTIIQLITFLVSAAEKHFQAKHKKRGKALSLLGSAEATLLKLEPIAKHPPRDTAYTYWVWNATSNPLTFTGNKQEVKFNQVINESDRAFKETCELLRQVTTKKVSIESELAEELIQQSASKLAVLRDVFMSLMRHKNGLHSERAFEPMFFMTEMRLYLVPYPVGGKEWEGVSAANLASQMSIDYLIGTTDEEYFKHVRSRFEYFPEEEKLVLEEDMRGNSVLSVFLQNMGLSYQRAYQEEETFFKRLISKQSLRLKKSLLQYKALVKAASHLTASHWSLIDNYLLKPSRQISATEYSHLTVNPEKGTSGMSMSDVQRIRDMRRNHTIASKLIKFV